MDQNGPPKMAKNGMKMDQKWTKNGPKMDQKWTENGLKKNLKNPKKYLSNSFLIRLAITVSSFPSLRTWVNSFGLFVNWRKNSSRQTKEKSESASSEEDIFSQFLSLFRQNWLIKCSFGEKLLSRVNTTQLPPGAKQGNCWDFTEYFWTKSARRAQANGLARDSSHNKLLKFFVVHFWVLAHISYF